MGFVVLSSDNTVTRFNMAVQLMEYKEQHRSAIQFLWPEGVKSNEI
jgi:hypothetical protein